MHRLRVLIPLVIAICTRSVIPCDAQSIPQSAIVVSLPEDVSLYRYYGVNMVAWGFAPWRRGPEAAAEWEEQVRVAQDANVKFQARIELDAFWQAHLERIAAPDRNVCRNLDGEKLILPWFEEKTHNGSPAYWYCSNSPAYRKVLREQVGFVLKQNPDAIMLDAQTSSALTLMYYGGCFCDNCLAGFRKFLQGRYEPTELRRMGIAEPATFHYGDFLRSQGYNCQRFKRDYQQSRSSIPFVQQFQSYQNDALVRLCAAVFRQAKSLAPKILVSTSAPPYQPLRSTFLPDIDFYTVELHHEASTGEMPTSPLLCFKIGETVGRPILLSALPFQDWRFIKDHQRTVQVRMWIAQAYANSAIFMVPIRQWTYGDIWLESAPGDYDDVYHFIRQHSELFDGYKTAADVVYLCCTQSLADGMHYAYGTIDGLAKNNIPFDLVIVGNNMWDFPWDHQRLQAAQAIVVDRSVDHLTESQRKQLQGYQQKMVRWPNRERLEELIGKQIVVSCGNDKVTVLPRHHSSRRFLCHLLNRQYLPAKNAMRIARDFKVRLDQSLCGPTSSVTLHAPGLASRRLTIEQHEKDVVVDVPELDLWAILEFQQ